MELLVYDATQNVSINEELMYSGVVDVCIVRDVRTGQRRTGRDDRSIYPKSTMNDVHRVAKHLRIMPPHGLSSRHSS